MQWSTGIALCIHQTCYSNILVKNVKTAEIATTDCEQLSLHRTEITKVFGTNHLSLSECNRMDRPPTDRFWCTLPESVWTRPLSHPKFPIFHHKFQYLCPLFTAKRQKTIIRRNINIYNIRKCLQKQGAADEKRTREGEEGITIWWRAVNERGWACDSLGCDQIAPFPYAPLPAPRPTSNTPQIMFTGVTASSLPLNHCYNYHKEDIHRDI